ncbi:MAG: hypothetical protein AB7U59_02715 [Desulfovibrionaceae bacterium]
MFRLLCTICLLGCLALAGCARGGNTDPASGVTVRTTGDAQVYGVYRSRLAPAQAD